MLLGAAAGVASCSPGNRKQGGKESIEITKWRIPMKVRSGLFSGASAVWEDAVLRAIRGKDGKLRWIYEIP
jgi:hypothetical protein